MAESLNPEHPIVAQLFPALDRVIRFVGNGRGVWASCGLCGTGLLGYPTLPQTAGSARRHLDAKHEGWQTEGDDQ